MSQVRQEPQCSGDGVIDGDVKDAPTTCAVIVKTAEDEEDRDRSQPGCRTDPPTKRYGLGGTVDRDVAVEHGFSLKLESWRSPS
jgi:hypothetical protein